MQYHVAPINNLSQEQRMFLFNSLGKRFVKKTIKRLGFIYNDQFFEDLIQQGMIGLWVASTKYDPQKSSFSNYAFYWIKAYVFSFFKKEMNVRSPKMVIMHERSIDEDNKVSYLRYKGNVFSFNKKVLSNFDDGDELTVENLISDPESGKQIEFFETKKDNEIKINQMKNSFNAFLESHKKENQKRVRLVLNDIFYNRLLSTDPMSLEDISLKHKITKQRVNQLEKRIVEFIFKSINPGKPVDAKKLLMGICIDKQKDMFEKQ